MRCGSKPARWRCRVAFTEERIRHEIPEEPAHRGSDTSDSLCLDGPTKKYGCAIPRTKIARTRNTRKSWQHFEHFRTAMARTGRYEEEAPHKAGVGANRPRVKCGFIRMRVIMAAASCSPAVARRRATYDGDFRVPTLLGAHPLDQNLRREEASARAHTVHPPSARQDAQANHHVCGTPGLLCLSKKKMAGAIVLFHGGPKCCW
jgi:hypothetical protein